MAIKPCKECGNQISDKAESCPQCGAKQPKKTSLFTKIVLGFIIFTVIMIIVSVNSDTPPSEPSAETQKMMQQAQIQTALSGILKDPESAKYEFASAQCGQVNSKNSFGGYAGAKRFLSDGDNVYLEDYNASKSEFNDLWKKHCP